MYRDLDVILAELKADDWLASDVDIESIEEPKTSVATGIELQYVMEDERQTRPRGRRIRRFGTFVNDFWFIEDLLLIDS